jgi:phosphoglycolate phosphatase
VNKVKPITDGGALAGVRALIFDLDGTLIDSSPGIAASLNAAFEAVGRHLPTVEIRRIIGPPINVMARKIEPSLTDSEVAAIEQKYRTEYDTEGWRETVPYEGVLESLLRLNEAGLRLFVVTNKPKIPARKILGHLGMSPVFEAVFTRDTRTPMYTSKTEMLAGLIANHRLEAATSAMVGDTQEDQEAAVGNGLQFIHATYGYGIVPEAKLAAVRFEEIEYMFCPGDTKQ